MRAKTTILLLSLMALCPSVAWAFRLSPMTIQFAPQGEAATQSFLLENKKDEKIAVEIDVLKRDYGSDGKEKRSATKDFAVFPQQVALEPGEKRHVRVTWVGETNPQNELAYRFVATQLPLKFEKGKSEGKVVQLRFLLQYVASIYVSPPGATSKIGIEQVRRGTDGNLELVLRNAGSAHQVLTGTKVVFRRKEDAKVKDASVWVLDGKELGVFDTENLLPGQSKSFRFTTPKGLPSGELNTELLFKP